MHPTRPKYNIQLIFLLILVKTVLIGKSLFFRVFLFIYLGTLIIFFTEHISSIRKTMHRENNSYYVKEKTKLKILRC